MDFRLHRVLSPVRPLLFTLITIWSSSPANAQEKIDPQVIETVKSATVFVRVEGRGWASTGSGFVVSKDNNSVLIATNDHVAMAKPPGLSVDARNSTLTVVFNSGTKNERTYAAQVVITDADKDLAILRVNDVKDPPKPIPYDTNQKLVETTPVVSFGFPFGKALSQTKGNPAVTIGRATISSLREDSKGELSVIQIDGNLNPGNSGGPIVDLKGQLVGVAVATIKDGQGIGLAVPGQELTRMMQGRVGKVNLTSKKGTDGSVMIRVEAQVLDPNNKISSVVAHYIHDQSKSRNAAPASIEKSSNSKQVELTVSRGMATSEFKLPSADGVVYVQVSASGLGKAISPSRVIAYSLASGQSSNQVVSKPKDGWKEYRPRDQSFVVFLPEKTARQSERERTLTLSGQRYKVIAVNGRSQAGLEYTAESIQLPLRATKTVQKELVGSLRDVMAKELNGKVTETKEVTNGKLEGEESTIESRSSVARVRFFLVGPRIFAVFVAGSSDMVTGEEAETILTSYRLVDASEVVPPGADPGPGAMVPPNPGAGGGRPVPPVPPSMNNRPGASVAGRGPRIVGGGNDKEFTDRAADAGVLVGFEIGLGKFVNNDIIIAAKPIYRDGTTETDGKPFGTDFSKSTKVIAKPGYAVGAITVKSGLGVDGMSVTFMKFNNGKLDTKDTYESEWVGGNGGGGPQKVSGDGKTVVGVLCKKNDRDVTGLGLIYQGDRGNPTAIHGGGFDPEFKDLAPGSALLSGLEIGVGKFFNNDIIKSIRPVYREENKADTQGKQYGTDLTRVKKIVAKPGYAVGAITVKVGIWVDGMSVTFMKVTNKGDLDPNDSYESEWIGGQTGGGPTKLGGDGTAVIGIAGRNNNTDMTGLGLVLK